MKALLVGNVLGLWLAVVGIPPSSALHAHRTGEKHKPTGKAFAARDKASTNSTRNRIGESTRADRQGSKLVVKLVKDMIDLDAGFEDTGLSARSSREQLLKDFQAAETASNASRLAFAAVGGFVQDLDNLEQKLKDLSEGNGTGVGLAGRVESIKFRYLEDLHSHLVAPPSRAERIAVERDTAFVSELENLHTAIQQAAKIVASDPSARRVEFEDVAQDLADLKMKYLSDIEKLGKLQGQDTLVEPLAWEMGEDILGFLNQSNESITHFTTLLSHLQLLKSELVSAIRGANSTMRYAENPVLKRLVQLSDDDLRDLMLSNRMTIARMYAAVLGIPAVKEVFDGIVQKNTFSPAEVDSQIRRHGKDVAARQLTHLGGMQASMEQLSDILGHVEVGGLGPLQDAFNPPEP